MQVVDCNSAGCTTGVPPPAASVASLPICANFAAGACPWSLRDVGGTTYFYYSAAFEPGGVGDVRVLFQKSTAEAVSVVAVQQARAVVVLLFTPAAPGAWLPMRAAELTLFFYLFHLSLARSRWAQISPSRRTSPRAATSASCST